MTGSALQLHCHLTDTAASAGAAAAGAVAIEAPAKPRFAVECRTAGETRNYFGNDWGTRLGSLNDVGLAGCAGCFLVGGIGPRTALK